MLQEHDGSDGELQLQEEILLVHFLHIFGLQRHDLLSSIGGIKTIKTLAFHINLNSMAT